ncbi:hypothetical protein FF011L_27970 [Roseimaritima multifibrata]|uniref:Uncharacterized protein n=1 Tax=Roseimaritima multifibrata TaxID=1930274 RepID=A0A517MGK7_9BACT|nr:hypothetical protein FF011L_27970 [Roseimaritima multifibrata]
MFAGAAVNLLREAVVLPARDWWNHYLPAQCPDQRFG